MTTADHLDRASSIPSSRKILCLVYGVIAVAALIATSSQMLAYFDTAGHLGYFWNDQRVTPASRTLTADAVLVALTAVILMVIEARRHAVKYVWLYVALGFATAISVAFPLFLIARELRMGASDEPHPGPVDTALLQSSRS